MKPLIQNNNIPCIQCNSFTKLNRILLCDTCQKCEQVKELIDSLSKMTDNKNGELDKVQSLIIKLSADYGKNFIKY